MMMMMMIFVMIILMVVMVPTMKMIFMTITMVLVTAVSVLRATLRKRLTVRYSGGLSQRATVRISISIDSALVHG